MLASSVEACIFQLADANESPWCRANVKRIGREGPVANAIINFAVHDLQRTGNGYVVKLGNSKLPVNLATQTFVDDLHRQYLRRPSKLYGQFSKDEDNYPTQKHLKDLLAGSSKDFAGLTSKMMLTLQKQASARPASEGGHVFFAHIESDGAQCLLVSLVNDKTSAALTSTYILDEVRHLDLDGYRFAGRIDLSAWQAKNDRYIGFLKGKGNVSEYFQDFLGCEVAVKAIMETEAFVNAVMAFADAQGMTPQNRAVFLKKAKDICEKLARGKSEIQFESVANEMWPDKPDDFVAALTAAKLNDGFVPNRRTLDTLDTLKGETPLYSIEVRREALTDRTVRFDPVEKTLTFTKLPSSLLNELQRDVTTDATPGV